MKRILTVAGSDSGGGAGIQADLKTITVLGGYGMSVITALTAQNTLSVAGIHETPVEFVRLQLDAVLSDIGADAVKTGMLASSEIVRAVADGLAAYRTSPVVVDPVMAATSGDRLLAEDAVMAVKEHLLPLADVVTPNLPEASLLCGFPVQTLDDMRAAAQAIYQLGPRCVLVKGGHLFDRAVDLLYDGRTFETFEAPRIQTRNTHGTGCTFSAAIATLLGQGVGLSDAVRQAKIFITQAIRASLNIGSGHGPTNPYVQVQQLRDREAVLNALRSAMERLLMTPLGRLIPEIRSNLGFALPGANAIGEVAGIPGRISQIGDRVVVCAEPAFGATRHIAKVILAASSFDPEIRSAMAIRYEADILDACRRLGFRLASFDRADEPKALKEREGSSLEWGTRHALEGCTEIPDVVYDEGEKGKEPIIRVLGRTPDEVVDKVIRIHGRLRSGA